MDGIELLLQQARDRRAKAIQAAKRRYLNEVGEIRALASKLNLTKRGRPRKAAYDDPITNGNHSCQRMTVKETVETILAEGRALTLVELTIEVQRRGCRARDDSRAVSATVRNTLQRQKERYQRDEARRWSTVYTCPKLGRVSSKSRFQGMPVS